MGELLLNDLMKTQHYSNNELLIDGLKDFILDYPIIEPFYGKGDLVKGFSVSEYYDISFPIDDEHNRDTLLFPPSYKGKYVITNPPYLAKNKAKEKTIFNKYKYDDLYKIAMSTILDAEGGILIIPINFFIDEKSKEIREEFLSKFKILRLNVYLDQMFENTAYNVCSFAFKKDKNEKQELSTFIYKDKSISLQRIFNIEKKYGYRIGGSFFSELKKVDNIFSRVTTDNRDNPTHINIICIDKTNEPLHFYYSDEPHYGKQCDRNLATLSTKIELSSELERQMIEEANKIISEVRQEMCDLIFTNYRDRARKRISFTEAYRIMSLAYWNLMSERIK